MKYLQRTVFLLVIACLSFAGSVCNLAAQTHDRIKIISRIDFAPPLFEMIRKSYEQKSGKPCHIEFQPADDLENLKNDDPGILLLVEEGINPALLAPDYSQASFSLELVWLLAVRGEALKMIDTPTLTLEKFAQLVAKLKQTNPNHFPWFEPLCSKNTLRNFCLLLDKNPASTLPDQSINKKAFWQRSKAASILYGAIENELLNPFSFEADLALAMNVFSEADAEFVSHWVPVDYLQNRQLAENEMGKSILMPFPTFDGSAKIPRMRFNMWQPVSAKPFTAHAFSVTNATDSFSFIDQNFASESAWIKDKYAEQYDSMIMGEL